MFKNGLAVFTTIKRGDNKKRKKQTTDRKNSESTVNKINSPSKKKLSIYIKFVNLQELQF